MRYGQRIGRRTRNQIKTRPYVGALLILQHSPNVKSMVYYIPHYTTQNTFIMSLVSAYFSTRTRLIEPSYHPKKKVTESKLPGVRFQSDSLDPANILQRTSNASTPFPN